MSIIYSPIFVDWWLIIDHDLAIENELIVGEKLTNEHPFEVWMSPEIKLKWVSFVYNQNKSNQFLCFK